jgi:hypothetical protein
MDTKNRVGMVISTLQPSKEDPLGSYTGKPVNPNEKPIQDSDDL